MTKHSSETLIITDMSLWISFPRVLLTQLSGGPGLREKTN